MNNSMTAKSNSPALEKIIKGSATLFVSKGYKNTSVRDIARHCGISLGALYHYIKSKEDILNLFREATMVNIVKYTEKQTLEFGKLNPPEALRHGISQYIDFVDYFQDVILFWTRDSISLNKEQLNLLIAQEELLSRAFEKVLELGCSSGDFEIENVCVTASNIICLCDSWALKRWFIRKRMTLATFKKHQINMILQGILRRSDEGTKQSEEIV